MVRRCAWLAWMSILLPLPPAAATPESPTGELSAATEGNLPAPEVPVRSLAACLERPAVDEGVVTLLAEGEVPLVHLPAREPSDGASLLDRLVAATGALGARPRPRPEVTGLLEGRVRRHGPGLPRALPEGGDPVHRVTGPGPACQRDGRASTAPADVPAEIRCEAAWHLFPFTDSPSAPSMWSRRGNRLG